MAIGKLNKMTIEISFEVLFELCAELVIPSEGGMNFFRGDLFNKIFWNYKFLAKYKVVNQKFREGLILQFSPVQPSLVIPNDQAKYVLEGKFFIKA